MKTSIKKLWVKALKSGEYKQGISVLNDNNESFCCLGVLCDLHRKAMKKGKSLWVKGDVKGHSYCDHVTTLPDKVVKWAEISPYPSVKVGDGDQKKSLATLNDTGHSFKEIAKLINSDEL